VYLICFGTRPELIKVFPIIDEFKKNKIPFKTIFTGQHKDLIKNYTNLIEQPDYYLNNVMEHNQSLNMLISKMISKADKVLNKDDFNVIVQGDSSTSFAMALASFNNQKSIIHIEAGLRTKNLRSPYPEEANRVMISHIADIHFCPTNLSKTNLQNEGIKKNVYVVGNTVVDSYQKILANKKFSQTTLDLVKDNQEYILVTLHRRENRKTNFNLVWEQLNKIDMKIIYIKHPSVKNSSEHLNKNIIQIDPVNYEDMIYLIENSKGIISDSGGLQEEAVCAKKKILICRDTTERPETVETGYGKLIGNDILNNIDFFNNISNVQNTANPYGQNVSKKIVNILQKKFK